MNVYHCDEALSGHQTRITLDRQPTLHKWTSSSWDELWVQPATVLLQEAIMAYKEHLRLVLGDPPDASPFQPLLVEGAVLLPDNLVKLLKDPAHAVWVLPTAPSQRNHGRQRGT